MLESAMLDVNVSPVLSHKDVFVVVVVYFELENAAFGVQMEN